MTNFARSSDQTLWDGIELCKTESKRLAGKKTASARAEVAQNAERFSEIIGELKRRGLC